MERMEAVETAVDSVLYCEFYLQLSCMVRADRGIERDSGAFGADSGYCHLFYGCAKRHLWHMRDSCAAENAGIWRQTNGGALCAAAYVGAGFDQHGGDIETVSDTEPVVRDAATGK